MPDSLKTSLVPVSALLMLVLFYAVFQEIFINCRWAVAGCEPVSHLVTTVFPHFEPDELLSGLEANRTLITERYSGRLMWMFVAGVGVLTGLAAFVIAAILINRSLCGRFRPWPAIIGLLIIALGTGVLLGMAPKSHMSIMGDVLPITIGAAGRGAVPSILTVMNLLNVINYVGGLALVLATCAVLLPRNRGGGAADEFVKIDGIAEQMRDLRMILYSGTVQLVVGVVRMMVVSQWTLAYVHPSAVAAAKNFNAVLAIVTGGFYTLVLIATYVPAALILGARARAEVALLPALSAVRRERILRLRGLHFSFKEVLPRVVALLAPLLAGPFGEFVTALIS